MRGGNTTIRSKMTTTLTHCITMPHIAVGVSSREPWTGALDILHKLRPDWDTGQIHIQTVSGGLVNLLLCCHLKEDTDKSDAIVLRVWTDGIGVNRDQEIAAMALAGTLDVAPPVYCVFKNGVSYKYIPGKTLSMDDRHNIKYIKPLTRILSRLHSVDVNSWRIMDTLGKTYELVPGKHTLFNAFGEYIKDIPTQLQDPKQDKRFQRDIPKKEDILLEYQFLSQWLDDSGLPIVYSHNDIYHKNVVKHQHTGQLYLLDFEFVKLNYEPFDATTMHLETKYFHLHKTQHSADTDDVTFRKWARYYLEAKRELLSQSKIEHSVVSDESDNEMEKETEEIRTDRGEVISEEEVREYTEHLKKFQAINNFVWALLFLTLIENQAVSSFDCLGLAKALLDGYYSRKHLFSGPEIYLDLTI